LGTKIQNEKKNNVQAKNVVEFTYFSPVIVLLFFTYFLNNLTSKITKFVSLSPKVHQIFNNIKSF